MRRSNSVNVSASLEGPRPSVTSKALAGPRDGAVGFVHRYGILVVIGQQFGLIQLLVGFQDAVFDHFKRTSGAFARSEILKNKRLVRLPVVVEGWIVGKGRHQRIGN